MQVFCSEDQTAVLERAPGAAPRVLPLPTVVDSSVVVLLHLLLRDEPRRPVVLDATAVQRLHPVAALLLASALRHRGESGAPATLTGVPFPVRRQISNHPLHAFVRDEGPAAGKGITVTNA